MTLKAALGPELPYLRRYARALTGSQSRGDESVRNTLEALLQTPDSFDTAKPARIELFRIFHQLPDLPNRDRQSLLLSAIEGFDNHEIAEILASTVEVVASQTIAARRVISEELEANVMIIEDEPIIALHIRSIVEELGHSVTGVARTRTEAVALANTVKPELVLADISLADGSSGIDAVKDILGVMDVPVIFITAFPERLLTGERPEPTYLITKPFEPETVTATIGQALMVHREQHAKG